MAPRWWSWTTPGAGAFSRSGVGRQASLHPGCVRRGVPARYTLPAMPLFARATADHYPDRVRSGLADHYVVLTGSYEAGSFRRVTLGPSAGRWSWRAGLGAATAAFSAGGYAETGDECRTQI